MGLFSASAELLNITNVYSLFEETTHILNTRNAQGFIAIDNKSGRKHLLWCLRLPLTPLSAEAAEFIRRTSHVIKSGLVDARVFSYGVDGNGTGFVIMDYVDGKSLGSTLVSAEKVKPYFEQMSKKLAACANLGIAVGTICGDSFILSKKGLRFVGVVPYIKAADPQTTGNLPPAIDATSAPELRNEGQVQHTSDIYSLGVLLYQMIARRNLLVASDERYHKDFIANYLPKILSSAPELSVWAESALGQLLPWRPSERLENISELRISAEENTEKVQQKRYDQSLFMKIVNGDFSDIIPGVVISGPSSLMVLLIGAWFVILVGVLVYRVDPQEKEMGKKVASAFTQGMEGRNEALSSVNAGSVEKIRKPVLGMRSVKSKSTNLSKKPKTDSVTQEVTVGDGVEHNSNTISTVLSHVATPERQSDPAMLDTVVRSRNEPEPITEKLAVDHSSFEYTLRWWDGLSRGDKRHRIFTVRQYIPWCPMLSSFSDET